MRKGSILAVGEIRSELKKLQDPAYRAFHIKLIPTVDPDTVIGVRTPELRKLAKCWAKREDAQVFLKDLPHSFYDENQLHAFLISEMKEFAACMEETERFLPYIDNWATCDQLSPKVFRAHRAELLKKCRRWIKSEKTYTVRFGIKMLMEHFLDEAYDPAYPALVSKIRSEEYYVNMMIAWYFATALAKQYDEAVKYLEEKRLSKWVHNRTIQKAVESRRIDEDTKNYLRTLRIK